MRITSPARRSAAIAVALATAGLLSACGHDHDHAHDGSQDHGDSHAHEAAPGHDAGHGHGDDDHGRPTVVVTHFTDDTELFMEYPALVAGQDSRFLAHFTHLADFSPVRGGTLDVELRQQGVLKARFRVRAPARDGLFTPVVAPRDPGEFELLLKLTADRFDVTHRLGTVTVHTAPDVIAADSEPETGGISYLKEQQWQGGFRLAQATRRTVRASVPAPATLVAPPDRFATVRATSAGVVAAASDGIPALGSTVERGQRLITLRPLLSAGTDAATLTLAVERAEANERLARQNLARLRGLLASGAVAAHRVSEAENALRVAQAETRAAQARLEQLASNRPDAGVPVIAPVSGRLVDLRVTPGAVVRADAVLAQIAGGDELWLTAQIAEADAPRIQQPGGAWFELGDQRVSLTVGDNARLIAVGGVIDETTRTLPVILGFLPDRTGLRINQRVAAHVLTGEAVEEVAVPHGAVIDDGGQPVVYVQTGGESFERRAVRTGQRDADLVAVTGGLTAGERVVSAGAYDVHLAAAEPAEAGHGHAH